MALKSEVETLQRRLQEHADFLESIRNAPEDEALSIVRRLRSTENVTAVLSSYQGRIGGVDQISPHTLTQPAISSTESGIEFGLATLHPTAQPVITLPAPSSMQYAGPTEGFMLRNATTSSRDTSLSPSKPYAYCDSRLENFPVGYWTRIPIDNQLAAQAISHFLEVDHPVLGFFNADLFLHDLVERRSSFCSHLLFSSVMSLACVRSHTTP